MPCRLGSLSDKGGSVIYLVQQPTVDRRGWTPDLSAASNYGPFSVMLDGSDRPSFLPGPCRQKILHALRHFNHTEDYILWAGGDPMGLMLTGAALAWLGVPSFRFLRWERKRDDAGVRQHDAGFYVPVLVQLRKEYPDGIETITASEGSGVAAGGRGGSAQPRIERAGGGGGYGGANPGPGRRDRGSA